MDANAKANRAELAQPVAPPTTSQYLSVIVAAIIVSLVAINVVLIVYVLEGHAPNNKIFFTVYFAVLMLPCIHCIFYIILHDIDRATQRVVINWVMAFLISLLGIVYPACFYKSKLNWVATVSWVIFANHVLVTALVYYFHLLTKGFIPEVPLPPANEQIV